MKIKVGYNKLIVSLPIMLAGILALLAWLDYQNGIPPHQQTLFLIFALTLFSFPMFFLPYIVVTENEIWVNNQFGMPRRRAKIKSLADIRFEQGMIYVKSEDFDRKLYFNKFLVDIKGLKKLRDLVAASSESEQKNESH